MTNHVEISVIVPVYNSEETLVELTDRLEKSLEEMLNGKSYQLVFINDGSADNSWQVIKELACKNGKITAINLTKNFGQHNALMCGFQHAKGKYVVTIDDDLQNPPEEIKKLYDLIRQKHDVVYGQLDDKKHSKFRNLGSETIQFVFRKTFGVNVKLASFRIVKKEIIDLILSYEKSFTFIDGIIAWHTKDIGSVPVRHDSRKQGRSGYSLQKLIVLSLNMLTNFSIVPVQFVSMIGIIFSLIGFLFGVFFIIKKLVFGINVMGFASLIVVVTIFSGVQLLSLGMIGEYIGRMHINISNRPQFAIREILCLKDLNHEQGEINRRLGN